MNHYKFYKIFSLTQRALDITQLRGMSWTVQKLLSILCRSYICIRKAPSRNICSIHYILFHQSEISFSIAYRHRYCEGHQSEISFSIAYRHRYCEGHQSEISFSIAYRHRYCEGHQSEILLSIAYRHCYCEGQCALTQIDWDIRNSNAEVQ